MEYAAEFIKFITEYGKLDIVKLRNAYLMKCCEITVKAANIETALMLLTIKLKGL